MAALDGLRILDMTQWEAGTCCTQSLAFLGADVVKVEQPNVGDPGRGRRPGKRIDNEYFVNWNSNKRSVTINLRDAKGRQLLLDMLPNYDVFVENYGPGVIEKLDIGYNVMKAIKPEIIYMRIKGFGTFGPNADYKCMDMVAQAAAGAFSITGDRNGPPMRPGPTIGDAGTGMQAALAITAAYAQRLKTGEGQLIELSMQEATTYYLRTAVSRTQFGTVPTPRSTNGESPFMALYPCLPGDANDYVFIMAVNQRMWDAVCATIGKPDLLQQPQFATQKDRYLSSTELYSEIAEWTQKHTKHECAQAFAEAGVCAAPVNETDELFRDPHLIARDFIKTIDHDDYGEVKILGWPARMSQSEVQPTASPLLGQHTDAVLAEDLGLSNIELSSLRASGVIGKEMQERDAAVAAG